MSTEQSGRSSYQRALELTRQPAERRFLQARLAQLAAGRPAVPESVGVGTLGRKKFAYDIWGDTVNIAACLESNGEAERINISQSTYEHVRNHFECAYRSKIPVKSAGAIDMFVVTGPKPGVGSVREVQRDVGGVENV